MKKVYFIYVYLPLRYIKKFPYLINEKDIIKRNDDKVLAFYGLTDNKSFLLEFMKTRDKTIFSYQKRKMYLSDYHILLRENPLHELRKNIFSCNEIILDSELFMVEFHRQELVQFYSNSINMIPIEIFNDKYTTSLFSLIYPFQSMKEEIEESMMEIDPITLYMICFHVLLNEDFYLNIIENMEKEE